MTWCIQPLTCHKDHWFYCFSSLVPGSTFLVLPLDGAAAPGNCTSWFFLVIKLVSWRVQSLCKRVAWTQRSVVLIKNKVWTFKCCKASQMDLIKEYVYWANGSCAADPASSADWQEGWRRDGSYWNKVLCGQHVLIWVCLTGQDVRMTINGVPVSLTHLFSPPCFE